MEEQKLVLMCGLPASGKTTWIRSNRTTSQIVICPDEFRLVLTGKRWHSPAEDSVWSHAKVAARIILGQGYTVIVDTTNTTIRRRSAWIEIANGLQMLTCCIWCDPGHAVCHKRNQDRQADQSVPESAMDRMVSQFEKPLTSEGFETVRIIQD